jgi:Cell Wall Hydrolase
LLTRSIDPVDPFARTIEERIFYGAKRLCILFAFAAVAIAGLDLMNIGALRSMAMYVHAHEPARLTRLPALIRSGISQISMTTPPISVSIARDEIPDANTSPLDSLAAARHEDAVAAALEAPPVMKQATLDDLAQRAQELARDARDMALPEEPSTSAVPPAAAIRLASVNPGDMPASAVLPISLPTHIAILPPLPPPLSPAQRLHLEGKSRDRAESCLAKAIYFEARDQPFRGQVAVAQVVMNRVFSGVYPRDVCGVIYQNASHYLACQFTFACNGRRKVIDEFGAWARARRIAQETLDGKLYVKAVGTATHYHATYVHPYWVHEMHRMAREGEHLFYRPIAWGSGADEPVWSRAELAANGYRR